ncbi:hypothetical protein BDP55DRAFT_106076 [Colletotrichum godetiae]|uniref:Uncharacterized protein n=1 Tax=Colletotrichum godetiae TaxID=1209918 RepID=A0AAJ0AMC9_9PEZI|nr:uncharacterized protein BDP55DRAFT_106076 [Colletotrichum godetiae]KAK1676548.1 hypothetical protein BDP55DRAFT_106076 [Colletotrichum godetiae]
MALSAAEHQARRRRSTAAPRRRIASDPSITPIPRRPRLLSNLPSHRRTSTPPARSQTSSPIQSSTTESSPPTPTVTLSPFPRSTLPRPYHDFYHFFQAMCPALRTRILGQVDWDSLHGGQHWRSQGYQPWNASDSCKTAFIIHAEGKSTKVCGWPEKEESKGRRESRKNFTTMEKSQESGTTASPKGYGCYRCHTIKPEAAFEKLPDYFVVSSAGCIVGRYAGKADGDKEQSRLPTLRSGEGLLRRFCIECGVRDGLYEKRKLITSLTEERWSVCDCRRLHWVPSNASYIECEHCLVKSAFRPPV